MNRARAGGGFAVPFRDPSAYHSRMLPDRDSLLSRLHELRSEHRDLDTVISRLTESGPTDQLHLQRLKKRKLLLKDEIAWLESRLIPDSIA
jgi:hypothetical protein